MRCSRCGFEEAAMKTVRPRSGGASPFPVCDPCYSPLAEAVWIVPGPVACFGTCSRCGSWVSVRDLRDAQPGGGRWSTPSGICERCVMGSGIP
jgi:hypothetical protein